jgi:hypothetical protein
MARGLDDLSLALAIRLRDVARMLDRLDRLESGTGEWMRAQGGAELREAAAEMALRALRLAADPINFGLLACLAGGGALPMAELEKSSGLARLALSERISDLVQVGLALHNIELGQVQSTAAGFALVGLINSISDTTARHLAAALSPKTE